MNKKCSLCGKEFTVTVKNKKWCPSCQAEKHKEMVCPTCGKKFNRKYQEETYCSKKCRAQDMGNFKNPEILKKIAETNVKRYGVSNPFNNPTIQQKAQKNQDYKKRGEKLKKTLEEKYKENRKRKRLKNQAGQSSRKGAVILDTLKNDVLSHHNEVEQEKSFAGCSLKIPLRFDFYIPPTAENPRGFLIEYDGEQHYFPVRFNNITDEQMYENFISTQVKDWCKDKFCIDSDIPLIRIKYTKLQNPTFEQIMESSYIVGKKQGVSDRITLFDLDEADFINYKKAAFNISAGISCTFKCCKENPSICHNNPLCKQSPIEYSILKIIDRYKNQEIAKSFVVQGLEPLDNLKQVLWLIDGIRRAEIEDDIILWTGYTEKECSDLIFLIKKMGWKNIIIKFGRYVPNSKSRYDDVLGVTLASDNQYAKKIS